MKGSHLAAILFLFWPLASVAQGEIYKTTDEQGNTVFTDVPLTEEAESVRLSSPNIADSVEVRTPDPMPAAVSTPASVEIPQGTSVYIGGNDNAGDDIYEARRKRELRDRAIGGQGRPEQLPAVKPTPLPAPVRQTSPGRR